MKIDCLVLGAFETNCYIARKSETDKDCLIIDTGLQSEKLIAYLIEEQLHPIAVIFTHGHADHITGLELLRENFTGIKSYIHKLDSEMFTDPSANLSMLAGIHFSTDDADVILEEGDVIKSAGIELEVIHTPGHTPGGICLYSKSENILFSGDTLFAESVGRTDFPGGDMKKLIAGIKKKLIILPEEVVVYPGHGPETTIENEKKYNPFL
ncbi:MAG: MBL fold metallo-hydrolase [Planctomycetota bacterium]